MDWQTVAASVVASLLSSGVIVAGIVYVLKKSIDRTIDLKYEKLLEENKLKLQESMRRKAALYNKQSQTLQDLLSIVYRLRNTIRDLPFSRSVSKVDQQSWEAFLQYNRDLGKSMYDNRAILPKSIHRVVHELNHVISPLAFMYNDIKSGRVDEAKLLDIRNDFQRGFERLNESYQLLVELIQLRLGVLDEE